MSNVFEHIDLTWRARKQSKAPYPWTGKDRREIKNLAHNYTEFGVLAMWDLYIAREDEWTKKSGYSIHYFLRQLPFLLDQEWKESARAYEEKMLGPVAAEVTALFDKSKVLKERE